MQQNITRMLGLFIGALALSALTMPLSARAANENFTLYGQANVSYDVINTGASAGQGAVAGISSGRVSSNASRLGVKGAHELGRGRSVLWQVEATVGADTGSSGGAGTVAGGGPRSARLFDRDTYLGFSDAGLGKLLLGRHDTPYKLATRRLDVFADSIADNRSLLGSTIVGGGRSVAAETFRGVPEDTFDNRLSNMIAYFSPVMGNFSAALAYANLTENNTYLDQTRGNALSLAGMYEQGPVYAALAYEAHDFTQGISSQPVTVKAFKLGLGYATRLFSAGFAYEKSSDDFGNSTAADAANPCGGMTSGANCSGHGTLYLSGKLNFTAADALKMAYSRAGQVGGSTSTGALQFSLGFDHDIDKRTTIYTLYTILKNDRQVSYGFSNVASSGASSVNATGTGGAEPSAISFGVKHAF